MKTTAAALIIAALMCATSCGGETDTKASPDASPSFNRGTVIIDIGGSTVQLHALFAQTEEQREYGLMNRESLDDDESMVFVFFEETTSGFWMKNTLIPLSVAFFDVDGKILKILDMDPCPPETVSCPIYTPGVAYMGALEVNQGAFDRLGVSEGDTLHAVPGGEGM